MVTRKGKGNDGFAGNMKENERVLSIANARESKRTKAREGLQLSKAGSQEI